MQAGFLALALWAATLSAEPATDDGVRIKVQTYLKLAGELFKSGDYKGALAELQRVDAMQELGGVRFNIARCLEELHRPAEALHAYERYLRTPDGTPTAASQQKRAREAIARLDGQVYGSALVRCTPEGVQIQITGVTESPMPCGNFPRVEVGTYQVVAALAGYRQETGQIVVEANKQAVVEIGLQRQSEQAATPGRGDKEKLSGAMSIAGTPSGSAVSVAHGGSTLTGTLPWAASELEPGSYHVEIGKAGEKRLARDVQVSAGKQTRIQVALADEDETSDEKKAASFTVTAVALDDGRSSAPGPSATARASAPTDGKRIAGIALVAGGGALLITSGVLALVGNQQRSAIASGGLASGADIQATADKGTHMNQASIGLLAVGVVAAGAGAALLVLSREGAGSVSVAPLASPGGAGALVMGRFP